MRPTPLILAALAPMRVNTERAQRAEMPAFFLWSPGIGRSGLLHSPASMWSPGTAWSAVRTTEESTLQFEMDA